VFDDRNHDLVWSGGDLPLADVVVTTVPAGIEALTNGSGRFVLHVPGGTSVIIAEVNPSGFISLSPDTLGPFALEAGDTVETGFADVPPLSISAGGARPGLSGSYVDFPHTVQAGTAGHVDLAATNEAGAGTMFMLDADGNGVFDGADRALEPADTDLDPSAGRGVVSVLLRVFVPLTLQPGVTFRVVTSAAQAISGTPATSLAAATDAVVVVGSAVGRLLLSKQADSGASAPGEIITYSIMYFNAGTDTLQNLVVIDPVSPWVDLEPGAFGPGQDVQWTPAAGMTVYLTYDPVDADECVYSDPERLVRWILSRSQPYYVAPGESGTITYRARVR